MSCKHYTDAACCSDPALAAAGSQSAMQITLEDSKAQGLSMYAAAHHQGIYGRVGIVLSLLLCLLLCLALGC